MTKEHRFVTRMCSQIRQMAVRYCGGTVILNNQPEESLDDVWTSNSNELNVPMEETDLTELFDPARSHHDGAVIIDMAHDGDFAPRVRSIGNRLRTDDDSERLGGFLRGTTRQWSASKASTITDALNIVVSGERGAISIFQRGVFHLDVQLDAFESQLRLTSSGLVRTLVRCYCLLVPLSA